MVIDHYIYTLILGFVGWKIVLIGFAYRLPKFLLEAKLIVVTLQNFRSESVLFSPLRFLLDVSAVAMNLVVGWLRQQHSVIKIHSLLLGGLQLDGTAYKGLLFR